MKKAYLFLATGFEEVEAIGTIDVLRRGEVSLTTVSIIGERAVTGAHGIPVIADRLFEDVDFSDADALILPGGGPGSQMLNRHEGLKQQLVRHSEQGKVVAAICAAPLVLGGLGLLKGKKATCYPGVEPQLTGAILTGEPAVRDGNIITGKGPGVVFDFALAVLTALQGEETSNSVTEDLLYII
ncbi:MAG: DJ-1/PfpI family protein [Tannerella sp.]|jgi:4-methyl-5(b-hydroxyethyl)-thiazole monophosphate biosynthesis|nr:DJ-1/PfpI family protein [Tannerella sp.]